VGEDELLRKARPGIWDYENGADFSYLNSNSNWKDTEKKYGLDRKNPYLDDISDEEDEEREECCNKCKHCNAKIKDLSDKRLFLPKFIS